MCPHSWHNLDEGACSFFGVICCWRRWGGNTGADGGDDVGDLEPSFRGAGVQDAVPVLVIFLFSTRCGSADGGRKAAFIQEAMLGGRIDSERRGGLCSWAGRLGAQADERSVARHG